ncbi:UNVERIFIED_CONTAM: hypothetical protein H355_008238 [Colinus virginianus]|nr:hypothetical protein H355_008238 [Colinus virginianus]
MRDLAILGSASCNNTSWVPICSSISPVSTHPTSSSAIVTLYHPVPRVELAMEGGASDGKSSITLTMKASAIFLLLFLAICFTQGNAEPDSAAGQGTEAACGNYDIRKGCTKNFDPICGTDDVLYGNECLLCLQNMPKIDLEETLGLPGGGSHRASIEPLGAKPLYPRNRAMDPCSNLTNPSKTMDSPLQLLVGACLALLIVFTLCGNIVVCLAVTLDRRLRSLTNCIIVSLAITDLLLALLVLPFSAFYELTSEWPFGSTLCNIYLSLDVMLCTASILNLFIISLDRYFAVTTPLRYRQLVTPSRVAVGLVVIWTVSLMVSFLPIHLGWNTNGTAVQNTTPNCTRECQLEVNPVYGLVDSLLTFYIPLVIMCITYYRIFKIAREQAKRINHTWCCSSNSPMPPMVKEHKATVTLAVVMGAFIVCWFPYFTVFTYRGVWGDSSVKGTPMSIVLWLGYANSALNPILYGTFNRDFRVAYQHLLLCWRTGDLKSSLQKGQSRGRSCRESLDGQEERHLKLEMRNGKGTLLAHGAL